MLFDYTKVPLELKKARRWVLWKKQSSERGITKVPVNASNGYGAKTNDTTTWFDFETALNNCDKFHCDGLGLMLGNGIFGVDLDCHEEVTEEFDALRQEFIHQLNSYTEYSQSGKGIHIICKGTLPKGRRRKNNIEMYDSVRFFALTGNLVEGTENNTLEERTEEIKELYNKYLTETKADYVYKREISSPNYSVTTLSDAEVIQKATESKSGNLFSCLYYGNWEGLYPSQSEADGALSVMLAFWCNKNYEQMDRLFRKSGLYRPKWDQYRGEQKYGDMVITTAINKCVSTYKPTDKVANDIAINPETGEVSLRKNYELDDTGNAQRFVDTYGAIIKYHFDNKYWMIYDGKTWVQDKKQLVKQYADRMIATMKQEMMKEPIEDTRKLLAKNIKHLSSTGGKDAMLKEAMHLEGIPVLTSDFDKRDDLLNCANGVVNLRTGEILPHDKEYMMSRNTNIDCDMEHEPTLFIKFLNDIFNNDPEVVDYIHKCLGYSISGSTQEQCLFQCIGTGGNGKSVLFDVVYEMMGGYGLNIQVDSILAKNSSGGSNANSDIARLNGARWVRTTEPTEGQRFNEGLIKQLTGGDVITARFLYGTEFEFKAKFKLWIACNNEIEVRGTDDGIWRRMRLIRFTRKFDEKTADKMLVYKLKEELPQILGWVVKGCLKWRREGLKMPKAIADSTNKYKEKMNIVAVFCKQMLEFNPSFKEKASTIYNEYKAWATNGKMWCMNQEKFSEEMSKKFEKVIIGGYVYYRGLRLKSKTNKYTFVKE